MFATVTWMYKILISNHITECKWIQCAKSYELQLLIGTGWWNLMNTYSCRVLLRPCPSSVVFIRGCHPWMASTDDTSIHGWHFSIHGWHPWMAFLHPWMTILHPWMTSLHPWITSTDDISPSIDGISPSMDDISPSMDDIHGWHYSIHGWHFHPYDFWWKLYASHYSNENSSPIIVIVLKS